MDADPHRDETAAAESGAAEPVSDATAPIRDESVDDGDAQAGDEPVLRRGRGRHVRGPALRHTRPAGVDDITVEALGKLSEALEVIEDARGSLYRFHRLTGKADLALGEATGLLRDAGHDGIAERIERDLIGRNVIEGRWTFQLVEEYDEGYYADLVAAERAAREELVEGRRHLFEAEMKEDRRSRGLRNHEARPQAEVAPDDGSASTAASPEAGWDPGERARPGDGDGPAASDDDVTIGEAEAEGQHEGDGEAASDAPDAPADPDAPGDLDAAEPRDARTGSVEDAEGGDQTASASAEPAAAPVVEPADDSADEPIAEPLDEPAAEPLDEPSDEPDPARA
jgi:hypothetical protein